MNWHRPAFALAAGISLAALAAAGARAQGGTVTYSYDALGRVVDAAYPDGTCLAYAYDAAGNRTQYVANSLPGVTANPVSVTTYQSLAAPFDPRVGNPTCGASIVYSLSHPGHGTATIVSGGVGVIYTPSAGYTGADSFQYRLQSDGHDSPAGTVTVTVLAPTSGPTATAGSGRYGGPSTGAIIVTDVTNLVSDPYGYSPMVVSVSSATHGTVSFVGNKITYIFTGGSQSKGYYDSYTYTVSDGIPGTPTATATISLTIFILGSG